MKTKLAKSKSQALREIKQAKSSQKLESLRIKYLGRKGEINALIKEIAELPIRERTKLGQLANEVKTEIKKTLQEKLQSSQATRIKGLEKDWLDVTLPGRPLPQGHLHLVTQAIREISSIFEKIGFVRVRYPEVEWDWYAFEGLNMPPVHPARDEFETFYIDAVPHRKYGRMLLTPHTSSGQLREMARTKPPIRMVNIAKCYRPNYDLSHTPMFHQFEGLVIDKNISITHLKGTLDYFAESYFGKGRKTRIRPFHFRFTEPSFEVDVSCGLCRGKGCRFCKEGWLELGGSGMVHPIVLKNGGVDPEKYSGFAFGWGIERVFMMRSKIPDMRLLFEGDLRILNQF